MERYERPTSYFLSSEVAGSEFLATERRKQERGEPQLEKRADRSSPGCVKGPGGPQVQLHTELRRNLGGNQRSLLAGGEVHKRVDPLNHHGRNLALAEFELLIIA